MKTSTVVWVIVVILIIAGGGWYWYSTNGTMYGSPSGAAGLNGSPNQGNLGQTDNGTPQTPGQTTSATVLQTSSSATLGTYLSSPLNGITLYTYGNDSAGVSNCTGQCAITWPPYIVEPGITLLGTAGVGGQLGTVIRADGSSQLTYNGMPLYTYTKDTKAGDINGNGVASFSVAKP